MVSCIERAKTPSSPTSQIKHYEYHTRDRDGRWKSNQLEELIATRCNDESDNVDGGDDANDEGVGVDEGRCKHGESITPFLVDLIDCGVNERSLCCCGRRYDGAWENDSECRCSWWGYWCECDATLRSDVLSMWFMWFMWFMLSSCQSIDLTSH